jgi:hypothetical protein
VLVRVALLVGARREVHEGRLALPSSCTCQNVGTRMLASTTELRARE